MSFYLVPNQTVQINSAGKLEVKILGINVCVLMTALQMRQVKCKSRKNKRDVAIFIDYFATNVKSNKRIYCN